MATIKSFEDFLDRMQGLLDNANKQGQIMVPVEDLENAFPELVYDEDERIRRELISLFADGIKGINHRYTGKDCERWLPWIEKQGKQKPVFEMKTPEESLGIDSETYNKIVDECVYGEQKPADKVEPKFKVGDFIVNAYCMGKVIELTNDAYLLDTGQGIPFSHEHNAHLWTIQDAKDGDVLVASDSSIFLFKSTVDFGCKHYVALTTDGAVKFNERLEHFWETSRAVHPATKEQRDLLFKKMKEAGYEWDADKKELNKIERKSAWSEEDETTKNNISHIIRQYDKISKRENQPCYYVGDCLLWMQNIKDRVQPQPKQEWSEEDESHIRKNKIK